MSNCSIFAVWGSTLHILTVNPSLLDAGINYGKSTSQDNCDRHGFIVDTFWFISQVPTEFIEHCHQLFHKRRRYLSDEPDEERH